MGRFKKLRDVAGGADENLLEHGRLARGVVTSLEPTGASVVIGGEEHRVCRLTLEVFVADEHPYVATVRQRVPVRVLSTLAVGSDAVAVRVDWSDARNVAIDLARVPSG